MFPHYNNNKRKNYEIITQKEIEERESKQEVHKKAKPDFFRKQLQDKSRKEGEQNGEERQRIASFGKRTELVDITNKDTSHKEVYNQSKRESSEKTSQNQTNEKKGIQEQLRRQENERERVLQNRLNKELGNDVNRRNLQADLSHINAFIPLRELNKISMTDHDMTKKGVDPEKFRRVSQELSNALENSSPADQVRIHKEFIEMAKRLGLIRPEV